MNYKYAAGILIYTFINQKSYILLGEDQYGMLSDFGGKNEKYDNCVSDTAVRECHEETCGCIGSVSFLNFKCINSSYIISKTYYKKPYYMYICYIRYDQNITNQFKIARKFLYNKNAEIKYLEKISLKWVLLEDMFENQDYMRNMFKDTINNNKNIILEIASYNENKKPNYING